MTPFWAHFGPFWGSPTPQMGSDPSNLGSDPKIQTPRDGVRPSKWPIFGPFYDPFLTHFSPFLILPLIITYNPSSTYLISITPSNRGAQNDPFLGHFTTIYVDRCEKTGVPKMRPKLKPLFDHFWVILWPYIWPPIHTPFIYSYIHVYTVYPHITYH